MADPRTIQVPIGTPAQTAEYALPPGVLQYIQSVVATVDTSGSGDVTPVLTIAEQSGVVVSDKQQVNAIAGGGSGRATWALGLADETQSTTGFIRFNVDNTIPGGWLEIEAPGSHNFKVGGPVNGNVAAWSIGLTGTGLVGIGTASDLYLLTDHGLIIRGDTSDQEFTGQYLIHPDEFLVTADSDIELDAGTFGFSMSSKANWTVDLTGGTGSAFITLSTGGKLEVQDHTGAPIFRVNEDGSLQGKTGQTLTFNL